jgi:hypothetical protein
MIKACNYDVTYNFAWPCGKPASTGWRSPVRASRRVGIIRHLFSALLCLRSVSIQILDLGTFHTRPSHVCELSFAFTMEGIFKRVFLESESGLQRLSSDGSSSRAWGGSIGDAFRSFASHIGSCSLGSAKAPDPLKFVSRFWLG